MEARVCGAGNMFVWAAVFLKVGPFNETLKSGGDFEWCRRVQTAGLKIVYNERMRVQHPARRTWREIIKRQRRIAGGQKFYQDFNRKQTNGRPFGLQRIINALVPKVSTIRKVCMDERLNTLSEQIRVGIVTLVLHYVWVIEVARLILGGKATRS